jgi:phosphopentomutase
MIVDSFGAGETEEQNGLAGAQTHHHISNTRAESVQDEAFDWMIVKGTICVRYVQTMVA